MNIGYTREMSQVIGPNDTPVTMETISTSPTVFLLKNFLSSEEAGDTTSYRIIIITSYR
jgi:hypothetical protein